jgi:hypothetical protein
MRKTVISVGGRLLAAGVLLGLMIGCGKSRGVTLYPVRGSVQINGEPAKDVNIMFTPVVPIEVEGHPLSPSGVTEEDGSFQLMSFDPNDGAPAGDYQVTIIYPMSRFNKHQSGIDRLKGKFSNPQTSGLKATVEAKKNEIPVFNIKAEVMPTQTAPTGMKAYKKSRGKER